MDLSYSSPLRPNVNLTPPYFHIFDDRSTDILGPNRSDRVIVEIDTFPFAHEEPLGSRPPTSDDVQINNGGTLLRGDLLLLESTPQPPFNDTIISNSFYGRQFNSFNDAKVHPQSGAIFFTDTTYGFENGFRPAPLIPSQVYRFDVDTGEVRVVADGLLQGIAFSPDGSTELYGVYPTLPATMYTFINRRVFAFIDSGVPGGSALDTQGNLYVGCGDGTEIFNPNGTLLGKVFLGFGSANMVFAGANRLLILADTKIFLPEIAAEGVNLNF
ncbi:D-lactonohydrolase-like protein [Mycena maculata]|uniref:D-lactonohydrolase-like protein n=1 Tax=Mycena maculata TaxID=230809 RepID=A0AAD7N5T3_9AGAR|nr:D-lactonohydrolase-like protein [Mycena maculata]